MGREIPILMSGPLVRATLEGAKPEYARSYPAKTQTRRPIKRENKPDPGLEWAECLCREIDPSDTPCATCAYRFPGMAAAGDRLWVRETFRIDNNLSRDRYPQVVYRADEGFMVARNAPVGVRLGAPNPKGDIWTPSIHMPRWASRITLPLVSVRVERVQDISESDAWAEGYGEHWRRRVKEAGADGPLGRPDARGWFAMLWDKLYGTWGQNPWVAVYEWGQIEVSR